MKLNVVEKDHYYELKLGEWSLWISKDGDTISIWCHGEAEQNKKDSICAHFSEKGSKITIHSGTFKTISDVPMETIFPLINKKKYIIWQLTE